MTKLFENSVIFNKLNIISTKIANKWNESQIGWLFTRNLNDIKVNSSIIFRLVNTFIDKISKISFVGKFADLLKSSVLLNLFSHYEYGVFAMALLAPIVPTMACVGIVILTFLSFFVNVFLNKKEVKIDSYLFTVILLIGLFFVCSVTSYSIVPSLKIFAIYFVFIAFMFLVIKCCSDRKNLITFVYLFITSGLFVSLYGIYQQFFGNNIGHAWLDEEMFDSISVRVYSTLGNPNVLGEYLLLLIPVCGAFVYAAKNIFAKFYCFGVMCVASLCMIFTQSRGCWLGLILVAVIFALLVDKRLVLLGIIGAMFIPSVLPQSIIDRFTSIGNLGDSSTSYRVYIWLGTLRLLKDFWHSGIGIGQEAFNKVYPFYSYNAIVAPHAHNLYLQLITETGIAGLLTFIVSMLISLKKILVGYIVGRKNEFGLLCVAVIAGLFGFLLQGMFDYVWYNYRVFAIFWMFIGLGIASRRCACEEDYTCNK